MHVVLCLQGSGNLHIAVGKWMGKWLTVLSLGDLLIFFQYEFCRLAKCGIFVARGACTNIGCSASVRINAIDY